MKIITKVLKYQRKAHFAKKKKCTKKPLSTTPVNCRATLTVCIGFFTRVGINHLGRINSSQCMCTCSKLNNNLTHICSI